MTSFAGKLIWVAGGAGHLGSAITRALDEAGATVLCMELAGRAEQLVREESLRHTIPVTLDLVDIAAQRAKTAELIATHGVPHGLIYLPFVSTSGKTLEEITTDDMNRTLSGALTPAFDFCRTVAHAMADRNGGSIVLFSSMYGLVSPDPRIYAAPLAPNPIDYGASKAAIIQMCRYLAVHYGRAGVRFNCVAPGPFPNRQVQAEQPRFIERLGAKTALGRIGRSDEIAGPALFLVSDAASYITGHTLVVDGGWTAW